MGNCVKRCMSACSAKKPLKKKKSQDDKQQPHIEGIESHGSKDSEALNLKFDEKDAENVNRNANPDIEAQEFNSLQESDMQKPFDPRSSIVADNYKKKMLAHLKSNNQEGVRHLLENGFPVNIPLSGDGFTAMHHAAKKGQVPIIETLLRWAADKDVLDDVEKWTPLMLSCINGKLDCVEFLLEKNANVTQVSEDGNTALEFLRREAPNFEGTSDEKKYKNVFEKLERKLEMVKEIKNANEE